MKYKKMIVLAIFLIAVLSVGAASAANQTDDSISSAGENIELSDVGDSNLESENMDVLSSSNQTVTPDNFFDYFDDDGYSKTTDDLVFEGEFNSPVSHITISSSRNSMSSKGSWLPGLTGCPSISVDPDASTT